MKTVTPGSKLNQFKWTIKVRCEERKGLNRCSEKQKDDPCRPPDVPQPDEGQLIAYTRNGKTSYNNAEIMFCPAFFKRQSLDDALLNEDLLPYPWKIDLNQYQNSGSAFLHELMHVNVASDSRNDKPNPHPRDLKLTFKSGLVNAYGPILTRVLAAYDSTYDPLGNDVGFYVQRNGEWILCFSKLLLIAANNYAL